MEENKQFDKLYELIDGNKTIVFCMHKVVRLIAILTIVSFYLSLGMGCFYTFTCDFFVPPPHYLGSFLGYNRFYVMSFVLLSVCLGFTYVGIYYEFQKKCSFVELAVLKYVGYVSCAMLPVISITNEVNSTHVLPFPEISLVLSYLLMIINIAWVVVINRKASESSHYRSQLKVCVVWFYFLIGIFVLVLIERRWIYKTENWLINNSIYSGSEWVFLTSLIIFIVLISRISLAFKVMLGKLHYEKIDNQIELEEMNP